MRHWLGLVVGAFVAVVGLYDAFAIGVDSGPYWRSGHWPSTQGEVVKAKVRWRPASWRPDAFAARERVVWPLLRKLVPTTDVEYRYRVEERDYLGTRVRADGTGNPRRIRNELRANPSVTVYYNPENPRRAVLVPGVVEGAIIPMALSAALGLFGLVAAALSLWSLAGREERRRGSKRFRR